MPKIKIIDVAQCAGVSKSTVSQYLNGRFDYMSKKTKEKIKAAVDELNYIPNPIARSLKTDKTKTIGVIVRDITGTYTGKAIRGIDDFCKQHEYNAIIYNSDFDPDVEAKALYALSQLRVDGIIIASSGKNPKIIAELEEKALPIVHFQLEHDDQEKNIIVSDYKQASFTATKYLIELGHKNICFVTQDFTEVHSRNERYQGYADALKMFDIPFNNDMLLYWDRTKGLHKSPLSLLSSATPPTAFFTQHLAVTIELLTELNSANAAIPEDVSLLGFDDVPMAEFFKVPITVIKQEPYTIGKKAAELLLSMIENKQQAPQKITVPCQLVERLSCKKIN